MLNENIKADFILLQPAAHSLGASLSGWSWCGAWGKCSGRENPGPRRLQAVEAGQRGGLWAGWAGEHALVLREQAGPAPQVPTVCKLGPVSTLVPFRVRKG